MAQPSDRQMRDLVMAEIRQAVSNYFLPMRVLGHLIARGVRALTGRPNPAQRPGSDGWWRSA